MKSKHLLSALLGTTLIFAACGNDEADKTEDKAKTESTTKSESDTSTKENSKATDKKEESTDKASGEGEVKASADLIDKAKDAGKDIKSYHAKLDTTMTSDGKDNEVNMDMNVDETGKTKIATKSMGQNMDMFIFDKKVIMAPDGKQYIDVTKAMGAQVKKQLEQLDYQAALKTLDAYKDAEFKKTADGYSLTKSFKNLDEYKKIAEQTGSKELVDSVQKQLKAVKGQAVINFDKDFMMKSTNTDIEMTIKDKKISTKTLANYDKYNEVKPIAIPEEAKNAKSLEAVQKEMQDQMNKNSNTSEQKAVPSQ